jgi:hypothetical protein
MWFEIDAEAGFGKFSLVGECTKDKDQIYCVISIGQNFVSEDMDSRKPERCWFIKGYCEGVVKIFARKSNIVNECKVMVDCKSCKSCKRRGNSGGICEYNITGQRDIVGLSKRWNISPQKEN